MFIVLTNGFAIFYKLIIEIFARKKVKLFPIKPTHLNLIFCLKIISKQKALAKTSNQESYFYLKSLRKYSDFIKDTGEEA